MNRRHFIKFVLTLTVIIGAFFLVPDNVGANLLTTTTFQVLTPDLSQLGSLKNYPVPGPTQAEIDNFIADKAKATALGKALFWDMQVGSDGIQSCATCHFHAGADNRIKNQLSPGLLAGDTTFQIGGPGYTLKPSDFPFHKLADINNRNSLVLSDTNDVSSSQGAFNVRFTDINPGNKVDQGVVIQDTIFNVNGTNVRQVEPRNTPTTINAVFNFRNFWDGRAQNEFNGVNPFGLRDPNAKVLKSVAGELQATSVSISNSSLASQAVGPPLSNLEMSFHGRDFRKLGRKMLSLRPLAEQEVKADDSSLGIYRHASGKGLNTSYEALIKAAFKSQWWDSNKIVKVSKNQPDIFYSNTGNPLSDEEFTQMEYNFSLIFGLAIQCYEATLVSDDTPFDRFMAGDTNALTPQQKEGLTLFTTKAKCVACHNGAELTSASVNNVRGELIERMIMGDNNVAVYDNGFYNIGVRPSAEDLGVGGTDPFGNPLSFSGLFQARSINFPIQANIEDNIPAAPLNPTERITVRGAFKTPGLRNIELTAPYFHNGGQATLRQVVDFYNRGADFAQQNRADLDPDIEPLGLTEPEKDALVAFLIALTDDRVRKDSKPFDHPSLLIPECQTPNAHDATNPQGSDAFRLLGAIGQNGYQQNTSNFFDQPSADFLTQAPCAPIAIMPVVLPTTLTIGQSFTQTFTAQGVNPATLSATGNLPTGLIFNGTTLSGNVTDTGVFNFQINATDSKGCVSVCEYTMTVLPKAHQVKVSDQKAGSVLVFPYYTSNFQNNSDTRITLSNTGEDTAYVHAIFVDATCAQSDQFICLTANASISFKVSEIDPSNTGWLLAVAVDQYGVPTQQNSLVGNAFVQDGEYIGNYSAESFWKYTSTTPLSFNSSGDIAHLNFNDLDYDAAPSGFAVEIQSPLDARFQKIVNVGLNGSIVNSSVRGAGQVSVGQVINGQELPIGSFSGLFADGCMTSAEINARTPRVPTGMNTIIPSGQIGTLKFNTGGSVGIMMTGRSSKWSGIRTLHKLAVTHTKLTVPVFAPNC